MNLTTLLTFYAITAVLCVAEPIVRKENGFISSESVAPLPLGDIKYSLNFTAQLDDALRLRRTTFPSAYSNLRWTLTRGTPQSGDQREVEKDTSLYLALHLDSLPQGTNHFFGTVDCQLRTTDGDYYEGSLSVEGGVRESYSYRVDPIDFAEGIVDRLRLFCSVDGVLRSQYVTDRVFRSVGRDRPVPLKRLEITFILTRDMQIQFDSKCSVDADEMSHCRTNYRPQMGVEIRPYVTKLDSPINYFVLVTRFTSDRGRVLYANCALMNEEGNIVARETSMWTNGDFGHSSVSRLIFGELLTRDHLPKNTDGTIDLHCYVELQVTMADV